LFLLLSLMACTDKADDTGETTASSDDTSTQLVDTDSTIDEDTDTTDTDPGEDVTYWAVAYGGADLVTAVVTRTEEDGGERLSGTTAYDYSAYFPYTATITEDVLLNSDGILMTAEVNVSAVVGELEYRERLSLDTVAGTAKITRPSGTWTWDYEDAGGAPFYWNYGSDGLFGFNQGTPISAQVLVSAAWASSTVDWIAHDYIDVIPLSGGEGTAYSLGDRIEAEDGQLTGLTLRDLGATMVPVDDVFELTPVAVEHGAEDVFPPDCVMSGTVEEFSLTSLDGTAIEGEAVWPEAHNGTVVTFNAGTGGADRQEWVGGLPRWDCLAAPFLDAGVAVVRYDDRAHGASGGDFDTMTFTGRTEDAMAVAQWTADHSATQRLYLLGHSEGVAHVSEVATQADFHVEGLLFFAGVGDYSGRDVWTWQTRLYMEEHGLSEDYIQSQMDGMNDIADGILDGSYTAATYGPYPTEFWEDFFTFNGADLAIEAETTYFVVQGDRDWQVPLDNGVSLTDALETAGLDVTYYEVSDTGHFLNRAPSGFPMTGDEYYLPIGWDEGLLTAAVDWVLE